MAISLLRGAAATALLLGVASCDTPLEVVTCPSERSESGLICAIGTVRHNGIEGGFWEVVVDGVGYDPHGSLPAGFRAEGQQVRFVARPRPDLRCFHMAGPIVEILEIETR